VFAEVAAVQSLLEGVELPADKRRLIHYALEQEGGTTAAQLLERLPDRQYRSLDEVGEALSPVQPASAARPGLPREESDVRPGGADYVTRHPEPGAVRYDAPPDNPPQKALEQQTKAQNAQKQRQEELLGS
jgi:hypothetical protein